MKRKNGSIEPLVIVSCAAASPYWTEHSRVTSEKPYLILEFKICLRATHLTVKSQNLVENAKRSRCERNRRDVRGWIGAKPSCETQSEVKERGSGTETRRSHGEDT